MNYTTYDFYKNWSLSDIPENIFDRYIAHASAFLDSITFNRLNIFSELSSDIQASVQKTVCDIADIMYKNETHKELSSETVDKYSVTYIVDKKTIEQRMYMVAIKYLGHTGLLYRGVE